MEAKKFARYEMAVIVGERQSLAEQGINPGRVPSLQEVWYRLPGLMSAAAQGEQLVHAVKSDPEFAEQFFAMMDAAERQQAVAA